MRNIALVTTARVVRITKLRSSNPMHHYLVALSKHVPRTPEAARAQKLRGKEADWLNWARIEPAFVRNPGPEG
ncbi:MAG: hypothetical protein CME32_12100 [Gimesia sp.]|nr:hypothetical protein [Gimesia sp.]